MTIYFMWNLFQLTFYQLSWRRCNQIKLDERLSPSSLNSLKQVKNIEKEKNSKNISDNAALHSLQSCLFWGEVSFMTSYDEVREWYN